MNCGEKVVAPNQQATQATAPQQPYNAPQQPYNAPRQPYGAPQQPYSAPQQPYGAPQQPYGAPQQSYNAPQQPYGAPQQPYGYQQPYGQYAAPGTGNVDFVTAVKIFFSKYADFSGRASKSEFWWSYLFCFLVGLIPFVGWVASLALFIPSLACAVRRLHDTGKSGTYYLISFIPIAGIILLIIEWCKDSVGDNMYGPMPR